MTGQQRTLDRPPLRGPLGWRAAAAVFAGGVLGGAARMGVSALSGGTVVPWGTLVANGTGAFALGYLVAVVARRGGSRVVLPLLGTGLLGSYTTFSAFSLEVWRLLEAGRSATALGYALGSVCAGAAAAAAGGRLGGRR